MTHLFKISVYNRAAGDVMTALYQTDQVPAVGDYLSVIDPALVRGTPFERQMHWRVDAVRWNVASVGSHDHLQWTIHEGGEIDQGICRSVDLLVWPAEGPFWADQPAWAWREPDDDEDEPDEDRIEVKVEGGGGNGGQST